MVRFISLTREGSRIAATSFGGMQLLRSSGESSAESGELGERVDVHVGLGSVRGAARDSVSVNTAASARSAADRPLKLTSPLDPISSQGVRYVTILASASMTATPPAMYPDGHRPARRHADYVRA